MAVGLRHFVVQGDFSAGIDASDADAAFEAVLDLLSVDRSWIVDPPVLANWVVSEVGEEQ